MIDLKLDPQTWDLVVETDDLVLVEGDAAIGQGVTFALGVFLGEWFLDESQGLPYFTEILVKNPNLVAVREWFRLTIAESPGITSIETLQLVFALNRRLSVTFSANGGAIASQEVVP